MAFTQLQLDDLKDAYARGVLSSGHGDKRVQFASLEDMWNAILRIERSLAPRSRKFQGGVCGYSRGR